MNTNSLAPDLIVHNGKVVTVDAGFTIADGLAVKDLRIIAVGAGAQLLGFFRRPRPYGPGRAERDLSQPQGRQIH